MVIYLIYIYKTGMKNKQQTSKTGDNCARK